MASPWSLVMLVTDSDESTHAYTVALCQCGCDVATATSVDDVLRQLKTMPELPDVIVLDIPLRRNNDLDAVKRLRSNRYSASIPIVFLDTDGAPPPPTASFDAVLHKPTTPRDVAATVRLLSRRAGGGQEAGRA